MGTLFPPVEKLAEVSLGVAKKVAEKVVQEGLARPCRFIEFNHENDLKKIDSTIEKMVWKPVYTPVKKI